ncbi:MAG TPA: hypothetical protein VHE78_05110 [Gemmatimonadaceae bacterium]|nr:hypothetical protein [Gemmatimonadaceae bacterium]
MTDDLDPKRLARLLDAVARLPRSVDPNPAVWEAIRNRIEARRVRPIAASPAGADTIVRRAPWLAAAAVVLMAASSGLTALLLRVRPATPTDRSPIAAMPAAGQASGPSARPPAVAGGSADSARSPVTMPLPQVLPASASTADLVFSRYDAAATELATELSARRARLNPQTVAVLDTCLRRIDAAIAEARSALRADPGNAVISELLTVSYRQKLDLLKRAADLPLGSL